MDYIEVTTMLIDAGSMDYFVCWNLQKSLVRRRVTELPDVLLLAEHDHVITLGRRSEETQTSKFRIPCYRVERGGRATYHGPGQLVGYPIMDLSRRGKDIHRYVRDIEEVLIGTLRDFSIDASRRQGLTGVWSGEKKVASIGIALKGWITYHGFALNVNTDLSYFSIIQPCGLEASVVASMEKILGRKIPINLVKKSLIRNFERIFETTIEETRGSEPLRINYGNTVS